MYYPKQIPYLLDKEFKENLEYIEYRIQKLEKYCMCIWQIRSKKVLDKTIYNPILPDACVDLVINFSNKQICFAGFSKETEFFALNEKIDYMGVRLKPGAFYTLFHLAASEVMDHMISFTEIEKVKNLEKIFLVSNVLERIEVLTDYLLGKIKDAQEEKFITLVDQLYKNPKEKNVEILSKELGYNKRHVCRLFKMWYGVSPKVLLNIVRLHFCLTLLLEEKKNLVDISILCGFYDQSHFIKEIKRYTGISPVQLFENYLDEMSFFYNTNLFKNDTV